ncbi:MAG TPA: hypothetical protein VNU97_07040 [Rhizomicrobium sp.]|jgi:hypothetical protein|nr:hypothetical protein [Rhizomicrobium sp.]
MKTPTLAKIASLAALLGLAAAPPARANADAPPPAADTQDLSGLHAFDFLAGSWRAHHHVLKERLAGSHDWWDYDGTATAWLTLDGYGNVDDNTLNKPTGFYRAMTLRTYDPKTGLWSIWWVDGRMPAINLDPPVRGRFADGVGTFYADDTLRGKPIKVRFIWKPIDHRHAHWEQAFSPDGGRTWETNWTTDFERVK